MDQELDTLYLKYQHDCNRWKTRAEALECALRYSALDICTVCIYYNTCDQKKGKECRKNGLWQFDEKRFEVEAEKEEKEE